MNWLEEGKRSGKHHVIRNPKITRDYLGMIIDQAEKQWGIVDPVRVTNVEKILKKRTVDHVHDLQLGGIDHVSNLTLVDSFVSADFGKQIYLHLANIPIGTKFTKVIEKVSKK